MICDKQGGFKIGMGCVDQIFSVRQVCEKYLVKGKDVFRAFMDLEKHMTELIGKLCRLF